VATKQNKAVFGILLIIFLSFVMLFIFASYTVRNLKGKGASFVTSEESSIAVVEINGVIMTSKDLVELVQAAEDDKDTQAIFLRINSPGGAVGPTQEVYEEVRRIDQLYTDSKGEKGKPVYASFGSIAASGGYYLGAATRRIYANAGTLTGSIGVIMQFMDLSRLYDFAMVKQNNITSGKYKDVGQPNRSMTEEEKALLKGIILDVHEQFMSDIQRTRKDRIKKDLKELAQGQIFSGRQAKDFGLVDEIASLWQAGRLVHKELGLKGEFGFKYIEKRKKTGLWALMENLDEAVTSIKMLSQSLVKSGDQVNLLYK
jgi:protease-4